MNSILGKISIRWKLAITVLFACSALLIMASHASIVSNQNDEVLERIKTEDYPTVKASERILALYEQLPGIFDTAVASSDEDLLKQAAKIDGEISQLFKDIKEGKNFAAIEAEHKEALSDYKKYFNFIDSFAKSFIDGSLDFSKAAEMGTQNGNNFENAISDIKSMRDKANEQFNSSIKNVENSVQRLAWSIWVVAISISVIVGLLSTYINAKIMRGLRTVINGMKSVSSENGDLSIRLKRPSDDELGELTDSFNAVIKKVDFNIDKLLSNMEGLSRIVKEITTSSCDAKEANEHQVVISGDLDRSIEELRASVASIAENASIAASSAEEADSEVSRGVNVVSQTRTSIESLSSTIEEAALVVSDMKKVSNDVNTILSVIQTIAEQTNLLALNAAIEAARAGEHGRGFAVVADEVRSLASKTQNSTEEIRSLLDRLNSTSDSAVSAINQGGERAKETVSAAQEAADALDKIRKQVQSISDQNGQIATATEEQNQVTEITSGRIKEMDEQTRTSQENITSLGDVTQELSTIFDQLEIIVQAFRKS